MWAHLVFIYDNDTSIQHQTSLTFTSTCIRGVCSFFFYLSFRFLYPISLDLSFHLFISMRNVFSIIIVCVRAFFLHNFIRFIWQMQMIFRASMMEVFGKKSVCPLWMISFLSNVMVHFNFDLQFVWVHTYVCVVSM